MKVTKWLVCTAGNNPSFVDCEGGVHQEIQYAVTFDCPKAARKWKRESGKETFGKKTVVREVHIELGKVVE